MNWESAWQGWRRLPVTEPHGADNRLQMPPAGLFAVITGAIDARELAYLYERADSISELAVHHSQHHPAQVAADSSAGA
jgi:hypothetical protein